MSQDQEQKTFDIYVDETSKNSPFMGVGALFTRKDSARSIAQMIQETIDGFGDRPDRELHWTKLKNHQLPLYKAVAVKLMACTQVKPYRMRFNALIVETSKIDRSISEGANREIILSKFMFGLIFQMASTSTTATASSSTLRTAVKNPIPPCRQCSITAPTPAPASALTPSRWCAT